MSATPIDGSSRPTAGFEAIRWVRHGPPDGPHEKTNASQSTGILDLYLLTETAVEWFPRLGYELVDRAKAAETVGESIEFTKSAAIPASRCEGA